MKKIKLNVHLVVLYLVLLDQLTKRFYIGLTYRDMTSSVTKTITNFLSIVPVWNKGVSFSLLSDYSPTLLTIVTLFLTCYLLYLLFLSRNAVEQLGLACIIGGAIGNLLDRFCFGMVFDFISIHYKNWVFPTFNLADAFITIGALILLYEVFFIKTSTLRNKKKII